MREVDYAVLGNRVHEMLQAISTWLEFVADSGLFLCGLSLWKGKF
jgi:hypothetical protein